MRLITEIADSSNCLIETDESTGKKGHYITGIFMQAECKNRNGRIYPKAILEREVNEYQKLIDAKRSLGELNHPTKPSIDPERVSHMITQLWFEGNNILGKAKLLNTPMGTLAKNLIDEGVQLGVSTRGMGSLKQMKEGYHLVQDDYKLNAVDIVTDPSGPDCFVAGIMEGREWLYDEKTGMYMVAEEIRDQIKSMTYQQIEEQKVDIFKKFMIQLGSR